MQTRGERSCCTASREAGRPRSTSKRSGTVWRPGSRRSSLFPRSPSRRRWSGGSHLILAMRSSSFTAECRQGSGRMPGVLRHAANAESSSARARRSLPRWRTLASSLLTKSTRHHINSSIHPPVTTHAMWPLCAEVRPMPSLFSGPPRLRQNRCGTPQKGSTHSCICPPALMTSLCRRLCSWI